MNDISNRIDTLIKTLGLTKTAFAEKLKVTQSYISKLVAGNGIPSERLIDDICIKFNVNEEWLKTGSGNMFIKLSKDEELAQYLATILNDNDIFIKNFIMTYMKLDDANKEIVSNLLSKLFSNQQGE